VHLSWSGGGRWPAHGFFWLAVAYRLGYWPRRSTGLEGAAERFSLTPRDPAARARGVLLNSTANWKPLLNGYSGFLPASYVQHYAAMNTFPESESIRAMEAAGVTNMFVHLDQLGPKTVDAIDHEPALRRLALEGSVALYRIEPRHHP
jgi:hypothetical protein